MIAQLSIGDDQCAQTQTRAMGLQGVINNTIRITRLKRSLVSAKVVKESNVDKVKYSIHDARTPAMINLLKFIDKLPLKIQPWKENSHWPQHFSLQSV